MTNKDKEEFNLYLANCTDSQVHGVYLKEKAANRKDYADLAFAEMVKRGLA